MVDSLSEDDVMTLHQAIAYRKASKVAAAVFTLENVMSCIKALLIERSNSLMSTAVKVEQDDTPTNDASMDIESIFLSSSDVMDLPIASKEVLQTEDASIAVGMSADTRQTGEQSLACKLAELASKSTEKKVEVNVVKNGIKKRKTQPRQADLKTSQSVFTCEKCGYQTGRKDHFKRHSNSHLDVKPFSCRLCSFTCSDSYHLVRHLKSSVHKNPQKKRGGSLQCDVCDYKTNQSNRMERHKRTHSGEKPFACKYCPYKAAQRATLDRHILTHTGEKPYKCEKCDYCAADTKSLKFHTLQKHGGEDGTLHQCTECDYSTPVLRYYTLHLRAHSDARPYLCDICGYSSKRPHGLSKHYRNMHGWSKSDTDGKQWKRMALSADQSGDDIGTVAESEQRGSVLDFNASVFNPPAVGNLHASDIVCGSAIGSRGVNLQQTVKSPNVDFNSSLFNPADFPHTNANIGGDTSQSVKFSIEASPNFNSLVFNPSIVNAADYQPTSFTGGGNSEQYVESSAVGRGHQSGPTIGGALLHADAVQAHYELFL